MKIRITSPLSNPYRGRSGWVAAAAMAGALALGLPTTTYAQDTSTTARPRDTTQAAARAESTGTDSTKWGYSVQRNPSEQNPPGYRGMERPSGLSDSAGAGDSSSPANATSRVKQMERQDSINQPGQNPPGYRGMERPAALDSAMKQAHDTGASRSNDSIHVGGNSSSDSAPASQ